MHSCRRGDRAWRKVIKILGRERWIEIVRDLEHSALALKLTNAIKTDGVNSNVFPHHFQHMNAGI